MTEKTPWIRVGSLQDQLPAMCAVPNASHPQMRAPTFHKQLYTVVILARCCGWAISVRSIGHESWANELPKPMKKRAASYCWASHSRGLDCGSDDHDDAANNDRKLAAIAITHEWNEWQRSYGTNVVHCRQQTQSRPGGRIHDCLPVVQKLRRIHQRPNCSEQLACLVVEQVGRLPIVTRGCGTNTENNAVEVQLAHVLRLGPFDLCKLGSSGLGFGHCLLLDG